MELLRPHETVDATTFGRRKVAPRACVADHKRHIREFLREALEDIDFITCECESAESVVAVLADHQPDLFLLGLSGGGIDANAMLEVLHRMNFKGSVLVFGAEAAPMTSALVRVGERLELDMLPLLPTPFNDDELRLRTASLRQVELPPNPPVDVGEALHANWLDLWYQPKIQLPSMSLCGAEALIRLRHPTWGVVPPAHFIPDASDPHFCRLSEFVITRAMQDWHFFFGVYGPLELSINLPLVFLQAPEAIENLARQMPQHPAFEGLIVEFKAADIVRDFPAAVHVARQLQLLNIAISIDDVGEEWPLFMDADDFPFAEIKVDRQFIQGCADDRLKQWNCRRILELADRLGARTVAEGVETRAEFVMARELGFDLIQGFFFGKPMETRRFSRRILGRPIELPK